MWIHGGALMHGSGAEVEFDGEGFARKGVILVTVNYRVGALGFFCHPDLEKENPQGISGNYGILDQIAALDWIYCNIENFGGDKNRITVAGQSAGCMSAQLMASSPLTKGKMRGAILQSGGGIPGFWSEMKKETQQEVSQKLMKHPSAFPSSQFPQLQVPQLKLQSTTLSLTHRTTERWFVLTFMTFPLLLLLTLI